MNFVKRVEQWQTKHGLVTKITVRDPKGKFHGATNFVQRP